MKTLKNTLKCLSLSLLVLFASCKKDSNSNPSSADDIKGYYIAGKYNSGGLDLPYIITFGDNAKAFITSGNVSANGNYTYKDGTLTIVYDGANKDVFTISDHTVASFTGTSTLKSYSLQKTPETNALDGKTFSGSLRTQGSNLLFFEKLKFNATQYGETSLNDPIPNKDYTLVNKASGTSNTGNNGVITFFVLIDGKLELARYNPANANGSVTVSYGSFSVQ